MKIIKAGFEIFPECDGANTLKKVERVARVCYKSEDKISDNSYRGMIGSLVKRGHLAMLEHGSIIVEMNRFLFVDTCRKINTIRERYGEEVFLRNTSLQYSNGGDIRNIVSGNLRAWFEYLSRCIIHGLGVSADVYEIISQYKYFPVFDKIETMLQEKSAVLYRCDGAKELFYYDLTSQEKLVHEDLTVKFIVDRGVSHELVRHRVSSFAQESTRYCNYGKSDEITVIAPCFWDPDNSKDFRDPLNIEDWEKAMLKCEEMYLSLIKRGATPQEARSVLPNSLKTEVVMTANLREWRHFFKLRALGTTGKPHPQMVEVALPLLEECKRLIPVVFDDLVKE